MSNWRANTRVFYGWWLVAALFFVVLNTGGMGFYCFPVFVQSLIDEFGWSMTQISAGAALWAIVYGFSGPVIGVLIARFGVTKTMLAAACISSLTLVGYASMQKLWMLYAILAIATGTIECSGGTPSDDALFGLSDDDYSMTYGARCHPDVPSSAGAGTWEQSIALHCVYEAELLRTQDILLPGDPGPGPVDDQREKAHAPVRANGVRHRGQTRRRWARGWAEGIRARPSHVGVRRRPRSAPVRSLTIRRESTQSWRP